MPSLSVHIDESILEEIVALAASESPREACGLLVGKWNSHTVSILGITPAQNIAPDPTLSFEIDPQMVLVHHDKWSPPRLKPWATHQTTSNEALEATHPNSGSDTRLLGFYHSHPDGSAEPSNRDIRSAWPNLVYLIVGVENKHLKRTSIWHVTGIGRTPVIDRLTVTYYSATE